MSSREINVFNLSFIDLLACGLGGALLLLLLFATLIRGRLAQGQVAEQQVGGEVLEEPLGTGKEVPPPQPMFVSVKAAKPTLAPLKLTAYPPAFYGGKIHTQLTGDGKTPEQGPASSGSGGHFLTEKSPICFMSPQKARYLGLFGQRESNGKPELTFIAPNGRPLQKLDNPAKLELKDLEYWVYKVEYPRANDLEKLLKRIAALGDRILDSVLYFEYRDRPYSIEEVTGVVGAEGKISEAHKSFRTLRSFCNEANPGTPFDAPETPWVTTKDKTKWPKGWSERWTAGQQDALTLLGKKWQKDFLKWFRELAGLLSNPLDDAFRRHLRKFEPQVIEFTSNNDKKIMEAMSLSKGEQAALMFEPFTTSANRDVVNTFQQDLRRVNSEFAGVSFKGAKTIRLRLSVSSPSQTTSPVSFLGVKPSRLAEQKELTQGGAIYFISRKARKNILNPPAPTTPGPP